MSQVLCALLTVYLAHRARPRPVVVVSDPAGHAVASVYVVLRDLTEPVLAPLRRVIPPVGMFDMSSLVLIIGLAILRGIVCS